MTDILAILLVLTFAGLVGAVVLLLHTERRRRAAEELSDGAVVIVDEGRIIHASDEAAALGATLGAPASAFIEALLGPKGEAALAAYLALERDGTGMRLLARDAAGRAIELIGAPLGGFLRLVLRDASLIDAATAPAPGVSAERIEEIERQESAVRTISTLAETGQIVAWNQAEDGKLLWSVGTIRTRSGSVPAMRAVEAAAAQARMAETVSRAPDATAPDGPWPRGERFRIELVTGEGHRPIALEALQAQLPTGGRVGLAVDASGLRSAEDSLARFVRTMTETFAQLTVGLAIFDRNQSLALFNPALVRMWQADPAWLAQRPTLREILDSMRSSRRVPESANFHDWRQRLTDLFKNTEAADYEELWHLADGSDIRVLARPHPQGALAFVFDDVTERLRLEQQFRHSVDLRRATLERLDEGLAVFGPDGRLQIVNMAFHDIWGTDAETVRPSLHVRDLMPVLRGLTVETDVWSRLTSYVTRDEARQAWTARLTLGTGAMLSARFAPLPDGSTMAVFADITASERISQALRERNEALEAAGEMRTAVLDQISYRLRTPLNSIYGFGQLVADSRFGPLNETQRSYVEQILGSAGDLIGAIDTLTAMASLEVAQTLDDVDRTGIGDILIATGHLLENRAVGEGVTLRVAVPEAGSEPACPAVRLRQIAFSMATGAIDRCRNGGTVELGARAEVGEEGEPLIEIYTRERAPDDADEARGSAEAARVAASVVARLARAAGGDYERRRGPTPPEQLAVCTLPAEAASEGGTGDGPVYVLAEDGAEAGAPPTAVVFLSTDTEASAGRDEVAPDGPRKPVGNR